MAKRKAATAIELLAVAAILTVLFVLLAPKFCTIQATAKDDQAKNSLLIVRDAIELYNTTHGIYPGQDGKESTLRKELASVVQSPFPACPVGNAKYPFGVEITDKDEIRGERFPDQFDHQDKSAAMAAC